MASIAYNHSAHIGQNSKQGWLGMIIAAFRVALLMKASHARNHAELLADWNRALRQIEG